MERGPNLRLKDGVEVVNRSSKIARLEANRRRHQPLSFSFAEIGAWQVDNTQSPEKVVQHVKECTSRLVIPSHEVVLLTRVDR